MRAGVWLHGEPKRIPKPQRPHSRLRGIWCEGVEEGIGRHAVPGFRIQPENFAAVRSQQLGPERANILFGSNDAIGQSLRDVPTGNLPAHVGGAVRGRVAKAQQQRPVFGKHKRADAMRLVQDGQTGAWCRPQQHRPRPWDHHPLVVIALAQLVTRQAGNGCFKICVDGGVVLFGARKHQMVSIDHIGQIDPSGLFECRMQCHPKKSMVPPCPHFIGKIQDRGCGVG